MWTAIIIFALINTQHPEQAIAQTMVGTHPVPTEVECLEKSAVFMNNMRAGLEKEHGKGSLLITGNCFSGWFAGPDGEAIPPDSGIQKNFH